MGFVIEYVCDKVLKEGVKLMWTKPSYRYQTRFSYVRKTNAYLNAQQVNKLRQALAVENQLYNFALSYLYKTYGYKHIDREVPSSMGKRYLVNHIKDLFISEKYALPRWSVKKLGLSSHNAQLFLVQLITNFAEYKKRLKQNAKNMNKIDRFNFKRNIQKNKRGVHTNGKHKSWYRIGALGFNADNRTILIDIQPKSPLKALSMHKISIPDYGIVHIQGNAFQLCNSKNIHQVKLKWQHDHTYQLQFVHVEEKPDFSIKNQDSIGLDWNMTNNVFYHDSNDHQVTIPQWVIAKVDRYEHQINQLKSKRDLGHSYKQKLNRKIQRLSAKRSQLLVETYRQKMPEVVQNHKVIVVERLDTKTMRRDGHGRGADRGFNRKLTLIKPAVLQSCLANYAWEHGCRVITVDSYKTSQVEFGTKYIHKHTLSEREFESGNNSNVMIGRDVNAAKNILDWGLHPDHHIKVKLFSKVKPQMVADFM